MLVGVMIGAAFLSGLFIFGVMLTRLKDFPLEPGDWFIEYAYEYSRAHKVPFNKVIEHSAIVEGAKGYIWATETESWDVKWFNSRGWEFPRRWIPYSVLKDYRGLPGTVVRLDA